MKYLITEEQSKKIDQSRVKMGPLGPSIRQIVDLIDIPLLTKYIVIYMEENDSYLILLWSRRGYNSDEECSKINKLINQYIPADITVVSVPSSD